MQHTDYLKHAFFPSYPFVNEGLRHKNCSHCLSLHDRMKRLKSLESTHILAQAGEVVLTPAFKFVTYSTPYDLYCVSAL
jgi:hypothetical protein